MRRIRLRVFAALAACLLASGASAVTLLDFENMFDLDPIQNFYNGGLSGGGAGAGPAYGITFSGNAITVKDSDDGGTLGNFANEPSPTHIMSFLQNGGVTLNRPGGFAGALDLSYSAINFPGSVEIFSGPNGTGISLALQALVVTSGGGGDPTGAFANFVPVTVPFAGIAQSAVFTGTNNEIAFDDVELTLVPEPSSIVVALMATSGLLLARRRLCA